MTCVRENSVCKYIIRREELVVVFFVSERGIVVFKGFVMFDMGKISRRSIYCRRLLMISRCVRSWEC